MINLDEMSLGILNFYKVHHNVEAGVGFAIFTHNVC